MQAQANAVDIPLDLDDLLLSFLERMAEVDSHRGAQEKRNRVAANQHDLGQLALVCRSWARICQKKIFEVIILRSHEDFRQLLSLGLHPESRISHYIEYLQLDLRIVTAPWIHVICMKIRPQTSEKLGTPFPNYKGHILYLAGGPGSLQVLHRGLHLFLPRRFPAFSRHITQLVMSAVELGGLRDIVRLSTELPSLEWLYCWDLTWNATTSDIEKEAKAKAGTGVNTKEETERNAKANVEAEANAKKAEPPEAEVLVSLERHRIRHLPVQFNAVEMYGCAKPWAAFPLLCHLRSRMSEPLCTDDLVTMSKLVKIFTDSVEKAGHVKPMTFAQHEEYGYVYAVCAAQDRDLYLTPSVWFAIAKDAKQRQSRVDAVAIDFSTSPDQVMIPLAKMVNYDWKGCEKCLVDFPALRHVTIGLCSREDISLFVKEVQPAMPLLSTSHRLRYARLDVNSSQELTQAWVPYVSTSPSILEESATNINTRRVPPDELLLLYP